MTTMAWEVPDDVQEALLLEEAQRWANTRFQLEARVETFKRIAEPADKIAAVVLELERTNQALNHLEGKIGEVRRRIEAKRKGNQGGAPDIDPGGDSE